MSRGEIYIFLFFIKKDSLWGKRQETDPLVRGKEVSGGTPQVKIFYAFHSFCITQIWCRNINN